ncbi:MAG: hypothetical protein PHG65_01590, partial [Kiritimatiellae bacterium]|nr:hypothetical protein [Kiritimatiellia bacterium]
MTAPPSTTDFFTGGFSFLEWLARTFPYPIQRVIARLFCEAVFWGTASLRRTLLQNLALAHPEASGFQRLRTAHRILLNYGIYFCDLFRLLHATEPPPIETFFDNLQNPETIQAALDAENGALLITPHLGNWELGMLPLGACRGRLAAITAPIKNPSMRRIMETFRERNGIELVTLENPGEYLFMLKRLLMERRLVTLLVDRYIGGHAMQVPFFGRETTLPCGYLHLARMFEAPIVPVFVIRNPTGKYSCIAETPIYVKRTDNRERDIREALLRVTAVLEKYILLHLDQWYAF